MHPLDPIVPATAVVEVSRSDRWQVYLRLAELEIPCCRCPQDQSLRVELSSVAVAIQLWSIVRQLTSSRQELLSGLERCWRLEA